MPINSFDNYPMTWRPARAELHPPFYRALAAQLEYDILSGRLLPHTKLPPQRELADFLDGDTRLSSLHGQGVDLCGHWARDVRLAECRAA